MTTRYALYAVALCTLIGAAVLVMRWYAVPQGEEPVVSQELPSRAEVEAYLRTHIGTLSPEPPVLGGTFYVTEVSFSGEQRGVVSYEDGHIALTADFEYEGTPEGGVHVRRFQVRSDAPASKD
jgi:hypothetical protein